jgi:hypothetical protein
MIKLYRTVKFFFIYAKNLLKNRQYLVDKYGIDINYLLEFYTTIILTDAPQELKDKFGSAFAQTEVMKVRDMILNDMPKLDLNELVRVYEITKVDTDNYGIAFGFSLANNRTVILSMVCTAIILITAIITGLIIIF